MTRIAIIGQGNMGQTHAAAWAQLGLTDQIEYVCTPRPGKPLTSAPTARFVTDLDTVLNDPTVDILSVCTPTTTHADIAIRALAADKNVLLEKPIALTLADAHAIHTAAATSSGVLMVAQVVRFFDGYRRLQASAADGGLGRIRSVRAQRLAAASASDRPTSAAPSWLRDESLSGGVLVDFAIHDFDQANLFLGTPVSVRAVRAVQTEADGGVRPIETTVDYANGGTAQVLTCDEMPADFVFTSSLELVGTAASDEYRLSESTYGTPYADQAEYFLECVRDGEPPLRCTTESAITALKVSLAARESLASGKVVSVE